MIRARLLAPSLAALLLLTGCAEQGTQVTDAGYVGAEAVEEWPDPTTDPVDFAGPTVEGGAFRSADHLGEVLVVNFWYAGCQPCREEAPRLTALADEFAADGVQFVGVNLRDTAATAAAFEREYGVEFPSVLDQENLGEAQLAFAESRPPRAVPTTLVLDREARVTARVLGTVNQSILRTLVRDVVDRARGGDGA